MALVVSLFDEDCIRSPQDRGMPSPLINCKSTKKKQVLNFSHKKINK